MKRKEMEVELEIRWEALLAAAGTLIALHAVNDWGRTTPEDEAMRLLRRARERFDTAKKALL